MNRLEAIPNDVLLKARERLARHKKYDITIYSIVKYFQLCMENNPNMIDSLFTPRRCVLHTTPLAELMIENRRMFLHKGAMHKLRGYAYSQLSKIENRNNSTEASGYLERVVEFETKKDISSNTTFASVEAEMTRRGLK